MTVNYSLFIKEKKVCEIWQKSRTQMIGWYIIMAVEHSTKVIRSCL